MYYFWRSGEKGELWLSGGGIRDAYSRMYPDGPVCSEVSLLADRDMLNVSFALEPGLSPSDKSASEKRFREFARELGFSDIQAGWIREDRLQEALTASTIVRLPLTWGVAVWVLVAVIRMGVSGTLLATAFGLAAFSVAALYTTERGSEIRRWFRKLLGKRP